MNYEVLLSYIVSIFSAALPGVWAFTMANRKAKENIKHMQQQLELALQLVVKIMDRVPI